EAAELAAPTVVLPPVVDGPPVLARQHALEAPERRRLGSRPHFGVEAEGAAALGVDVPVARRHPFVGTVHLHRRGARYLTRVRGTGDERRPRRVDLAEHLAIAALELRLREQVAREVPDDDRWVVAQAHHLVVEHALDERHLGFRVYAAVVRGDGRAEVGLP